ncbi:MAG: putative toxin-antitoxin system toxin component, PIN family [Saprospiraceae bacterium]|nr:putative toxin-antitoxin system toxin component, PIN family [Lewinellaceae bacterium]MBP6812447.1 putative toxin-antitoxin system toxin component, PIN family [Saprospiraceae bacterium]
MRIVLDTNVLSVAISRRSKLYPIWLAVRNGDFEMLVTTDILFEYSEVLTDDLSQEVSENVLDTLETLPNIIPVHKYYFWNLITVDPDDNKFVDCAVAGSANYIVTDDKHFNVLKTISFPKVEVLSSDQFLELVLSGKS